MEQDYHKTMEVTTVIRVNRHHHALLISLVMVCSWSPQRQHTHLKLKLNSKKRPNFITMEFQKHC